MQPTPQTRRPAGSTSGGQFTGVEKPAVDDQALRFNGTDADWDRLETSFLGLQTVFTRHVAVGGAVTVSTDGDDPSVWMLAHKNDASYWSDGNWSRHKKDRQQWSAPIVAQMLSEGLVAVVDKNEESGVYTAMHAASSPKSGDWRHGPHILTGKIAQSRGLRLIHSLAPRTTQAIGKLGDYDARHDRVGDRLGVFKTVFSLYQRFDRPPWPDGPPWTKPDEHGYVTFPGGASLFVGANGDLLWRVLTEPDQRGLSWLSDGLRWTLPMAHELVTAAALYDSETERQLTTGLFDNTTPTTWDADQTETQRRLMLRFFNSQLGDNTKASCWTSEQQTKIRGFIETVEALEPPPGLGLVSEDRVAAMLRTVSGVEESPNVEER